MKTLFCGDVSPTPDTWDLFLQGDLDALFGDTQSLFRDQDACVINLECALTDVDCPIQKFGPALRAPTSTAQVLKKVGVTHCGLSNNHVFDHDVQGVESTVRSLEAAGIGWTGFGNNEEDSRKDLVIEKDGETLCVIAVCEHEYSYAMPHRMGCRPFDPFDTPLDIRAAKEKYDRVVVMYHGGKEQCRYPSPRLRKACQAMAKSGADLILCQHSHCIGCYEQVAGCHILYGQGNFLFVKFANGNLPGWNDCLAVSYDTKTHQVEWIPVVAEGRGIRLATAQEAKELMDAFAERNATLEDGTWLQGWRAFCEEKREPYTRVVARGCVEEFGEKGVQMFAHYLDCEAHTDVWRELFKTWHGQKGN